MSSAIVNRHTSMFTNIRTCWVMFKWCSYDVYTMILFDKMNSTLNISSFLFSMSISHSYNSQSRSLRFTNDSDIFTQIANKTSYAFWITNFRWSLKCLVSITRSYLILTSVWNWIWNIMSGMYRYLLRLVYDLNRISCLEIDVYVSSEEL